MRRGVAAAAVPLMILVACSSTTSSTSSPAASSTTPASSGASCVNQNEWDAALQSAQGHVTSAVSAATSFNFGSAKEELEKAGEALQHAADIAGEVSPTLKSDLQQASDSVDKAITDLQNNDAGAAGSDLAAAGSHLAQAGTDADNFFC